MKNYIGSFLKKHLRISLVVIFFISLIFLPQFNFCSSNQAKVSNINVLAPNDEDEFSQGTKVYIRWSTSNSNTALLPDTHNYTLTKNSLMGNKTAVADLGLNSAMSELQRNSILKHILKKSSVNCDTSGMCDDACSGAADEIAKAFLIGSAIVGGVVLIVTGIIIIAVVNARKDKAPSDDIDIDLFKDEELVFNIARKTPNDGVYEWIVPDDLQPGDDYAIKISLANNPEISAMTDGNFTINSEEEVEEEENTENTNEPDNNNNNIDNNDNNNPVNNENEETKDNIITKAHRETFSYMDDEIKGFDMSLLPDSMKHYVYFNLDNAENEMNDVSGKKEKVINKFLNKTIKENIANYMLPYEKDFAHKLARNTAKENLELFSDVKEIVMGIETILNYPERPPMTMLLLVEDAQTITDRLSAQPDVFIKDSIEGLEVYKSNTTNTIIFNESVIGITTKGLEYELIRSFNNPNLTMKNKIERDRDLVWSDLDFDELKYDINLSSMNINPNKLDKLNVNLSRNEHSFSLETEIYLKDASLTEEYASVFNDALNKFKAPITTALTTTQNNRGILSVMNDLELQSGESSIYIDLEIQDDTINDIFKRP